MNNINRRKFLTTTGTLVAGTVITNSLSGLSSNVYAGNKMKLAAVGTGIRQTDMFGKKLTKDYSDYVEYVGLCDINPGRLEYAKNYIGVNCPTFTDFDEMMRNVKPDKLIVTTVDSEHDQFIVKGLEYGVDVITEKPMTTDEIKAQAILDAERRSKNSVIVTFNYRYSPHRRKIKELLMENAIGKITSVDFHWYLDTEHGPRYFRRWHGLREKGGTLLVHKSTHHFDLVNWWLDSDPDEVMAYGDLEVFGSKGPFRSKSCRACEFKDKCTYFYDITQDERNMRLYVDNEHYDGYIRDACIYRNEINIYDKMSVQVKYKNNVLLNYSLTTYSPYEGYRIAFNGTEGRIEAWIHERQTWPMEEYDEIMLIRNFEKPEYFRISNVEAGHGGGDKRMLDKLFKDPNQSDPLSQSAGTRDGCMSVLTGIAARKSIDTGKPVLVSDLTDLGLMEQRPK
ncbi:MAG: Gfo/Idh/MocA family oxidoreductase [Ignavibacterium sp.]|nr:MAG: Gfo/Idh/MocA family oxidoreductase [Ignavibacterium sp.]